MAGINATLKVRNEAPLVLKRDEAYICLLYTSDNLKNAKDELLIAQKKHAELLRDMANEEDVETNLLMIHAEDHVFGAQNTLEMANEIVELYGLSLIHI